MRYYEITEAVRPSLLYHATTLDNLYEILDSDEIMARTAHVTSRAQHWSIRKRDTNRDGYYINGVSLTRSAAFAHRWCSRTPPWQETPLQGVVLVLDAAKLRLRHRIIPVAFWTSGGGAWMSDDARTKGDESEEFVIGAIKPLRPYLIEVMAAAEVIKNNDILSFAAQDYGVKLSLA